MIQAAEPPGQTTSAVAGAIWGPHLVEDSDRVAEWCAGTLGTLTGLAGQPGTGVRLAAGVMAIRAADAGPDLPTELAMLGDGIQPCAAAEPAGRLRRGLAVHRPGRVDAGVPGLPAGPVPPGRR